MSAKQYVADRAWRALKRHPGITQKELREKLGWGANETAQVLSRLRKHGYARHGGARQVNTQWFAIGTQPPQNRSGTHPNSVIGLRKGWEKQFEFLRMAFLAKGIDPAKIGQGRARQFKPLPFGEPCALAECWTMPSSRKRAA